MRIENPTVEDRGDRRRMAADFVWEETDRAPQRIWLETASRYADRLALDPHAWLVAGAVPALRAGERRIALEGPVCPQLRDGLTFAMQLLSHWYAPQRRLPEIEPARGFAPARRPPPPRTAMFLSGGVDSLALLWHNRRDHPRGHPDAIAAGFFIEGLDIGGPRGQQGEFYGRAARALEPVVEDAGIDLIPVHTNLLELDDAATWPYEYMSAPTAAIAHAFADHYGKVLLAAGAHISGLHPHGSHPMLDPCYSSSALRFVPAGMHLRRVEKVRALAGWNAAISALRVCCKGIADGAPLNCGRCRKCVTTALELVVAGRLQDCPALPLDDVAPEMIDRMRVKTLAELAFLEELVDPCRKIGRLDLAGALERKIRVVRRRIRRRDGVSWLRLGPLKRRIRARFR